MGTARPECKRDKAIIAQSIPNCESTNVEEGKMLINPCMATSEMERRYEFVSEGTQTARWLKRFAVASLHISRDHLLQATGDALNALGAWVQRKGRLDSAHS